MKAIVWTAYGPPDVLQFKEVDKPVARKNEVLIRIQAAAVSMGDCEQRSLKLPIWYRIPMRVYAGFKKPERITTLGMDLAGEVESAGKEINRFKEGDQVFAVTGFAAMGAYAEYITLPEEPEGGALEIKPSNLTYAEAAAVPTGGLKHCVFSAMEMSSQGKRF